MNSLRTLIVDDSETMRRVLRAVVNGYRGVEVVGEAGNGEQAIQQVHSLTPDLVIMDVSMPVLNGLTAAEFVKKYWPQTEVLIFTAHRFSYFIDAAKYLGLSGFVCKEDGGQSLLSALDAVIHHHTYFPL